MRRNFAVKMIQDSSVEINFKEYEATTTRTTHPDSSVAPRGDIMRSTILAEL